MIHPLLIGLVTGLRSMSPLAIVSEAARRDLLPPNGAPRIITGGWRRPPWPRPRGAGKRWRSAWPAR